MIALLKKIVERFSVHSKTTDEFFSDTAPSALAHSPQPHGCHVLVAEDQELSRKVVGVLLQSMGHRVSYAEDGVQALELAKLGGIDLVLMDIHMPLMDGLTCARLIRALPGPQAFVTMVALTADLNAHTVEQAKLAGMQEVLSKPLQKSLLAHLLPEKSQSAFSDRL